MALREIRFLLAGAVSLLLLSCATYPSKVDHFLAYLSQGRPAEAASDIRDLAFKEGDDQVVYLLEYGTAQQMAGDYKESNKAFLKAEDLMDIKDYHSISRITGSLLLNQGMVQYKGEDHEKILVNAMLAVNYLMLGQLDEAQVETRKLNDKLYRYRFEGKKNYQQNPFAIYLSALIWEAGRNWDSAYIDFKKAYELNPRLEYLKEDLIRSAARAQRFDELAKWRKEFPNIKSPPSQKLGEVVLIYQQGWGPQKQPNPAFPRVPRLYPRYSVTQGAQLEVENLSMESAQMAVNVTDVSIQTLDEQYSDLVAQRVGGIVTKAVIADQVRQKDNLLGDLLWLGLNLADQADLRQWASLPSSIQIAKLRLKEGDYRIRVVGLDGARQPSGETSAWFSVKVQNQRKHFLNWRSIQ